MVAIAVAIVAAGRGARMGRETPKQLLPLGGKPVLRWSAEAFAARPDVTRIVVAASTDQKDAVESALSGLPVRVEVILGGATRSLSVRACLEALVVSSAPDVVFVHDAARPFVGDEVIDRLIAALSDHDVAAPVLRPPDALKVRRPDGGLGEDIARDGVAAVQTPQAARFAPLLGAYRTLPADADLPDDLAVAHRAGLRVAGVDGDPNLFKITVPSDLARAEALVGPPEPAPIVATGFGFDAHRLTQGDGMTLCGVPIPGPLALVGHSDADAGLHAVTDAVLGALGAGDIGDHFPPSDPQWAGVASRRFLEHAVALAREDGASIAHADLTLVCERPKIAPHREAMRAALAEILGVPIKRASVKATTTEGMGFTGRREGLAAQAVVTLTWSGAAARED